MGQEYFRIAFVPVENRSIQRRAFVLQWIKVFVQKELQVSMIPFEYKEYEIVNVKLWIKIFDFTRKKNCVDFKENLIVLVKSTECNSKGNMKLFILPISLRKNNVNTKWNIDWRHLYRKETRTSLTLLPFTSFSIRSNRKHKRNINFKAFIL